jgi:uncharacterized membrane protein YfcA
VTPKRQRQTAAQRRRGRRLRLAAWIVIMFGVAAGVWWFLGLAAVWKVAVVGVIVVLVAVWWLFTRRRDIADEMHRREPDGR